jgi:hypothetical protein
VRTLGRGFTNRPAIDGADPRILAEALAISQPGPDGFEHPICTVPSNLGPRDEISSMYWTDGKPP